MHHDLDIESMGSQLLEVNIRETRQQHKRRWFFRDPEPCMRGMDAQLDFVFRRFLAGRKLRKGSPGVTEEFEVGPLPAGYDLYCSVRLDLIGF
jgi:hypothetical protein